MIFFDFTGSWFGDKDSRRFPFSYSGPLVMKSKSWHCIGVWWSGCLNTCRLFQPFHKDFCSLFHQNVKQLYQHFSFQCVVFRSEAPAVYWWILIHWVWVVSLCPKPASFFLIFLSVSHLKWWPLCFGKVHVVVYYYAVTQSAVSQDSESRKIFLVQILLKFDV